MRILKETDIDFLSKRKTALIFSVFLIVAGLAVTIFKGGPNYSIDFLGGTEIRVGFDQLPPTNDVRQTLADIGFANAEIKVISEIGNPKDDILVRIEQQQLETQISDSVMAALQAQFSANLPVNRGVDSVGPKIGSELREAGVLSVIFSLLLILVYISIRFEFVYGIGAIAALFHDVLITFGMFSIIGFELSLSVIAAFLTIIGYSLNDTIVVFDRIRENVKKLRKEKFTRVLNISINQSLSRTVVTSLTTLLVVLVLFLLGGEVLRSFSFALLIGVLVGTYSSVFIATPVVAEWQERRMQKQAQKPAAKRK